MISNQKLKAADTDALIHECRMITHYLLGQSPSPEIIQRYIEATSTLIPERIPPSDIATVNFVQRHPWSLPYLDAASALLRPQSVLRSKILLMMAVLEATPQFTDAFIPEFFSIPQFLWRMAGYGISSALKVTIGILVYPFAVYLK